MKKIDVIPINKEQYISLTKYIKTDNESIIKLRSLDSFHFMPSSLDKLASNLTSDQFHEIQHVLPKEN